MRVAVAEGKAKTVIIGTLKIYQKVGDAEPILTLDLNDGSPIQTDIEIVEPLVDGYDDFEITFRQVLKVKLS